MSRNFNGEKIQRDQSKTFDVDALLVLASASKFISQKNKANEAGSFAPKYQMLTFKENMESKLTHSLMPIIH